MAKIKDLDENSIGLSDTTESIGQMLLTRLTPHTQFKNLMSDENPGFLPIPDEYDYVDVFRYATEDDIDPLIQIDQQTIDQLVKEAPDEVSKILPTCQPDSQLRFVKKSLDDYVRNAQQLRILDDLIVNLQPGIDIVLQKLRERWALEYAQISKRKSSVGK